MKTPKQIFEDLCEKAINLGIMKPYRSIRKQEFDKPGRLILKQSAEDRELLKQLSSEDIEKANILRKEYWTDNTKPTELEKMHTVLEKKLYDK
jgi:hypothetical protein